MLITIMIMIIAYYDMNLSPWVPSRTPKQLRDFDSRDSRRKISGRLNARPRWVGRLNARPSLYIEMPRRATWASFDAAAKNEVESLKALADFYFNVEGQESLQRC